jgi:hypothetical protein
MRCLFFENDEKQRNRMHSANTELAFQNEQKEKRAAELINANNELIFQNESKTQQN